MSNMQVKQLIRSSALSRGNDHFNFPEKGLTVKLADRPSSFKRITFSKFDRQLKKRNQVLRQENLRLVSKLMDIKSRKFRLTTTASSCSLSKRQNYMRNRQISTENKRLGESLLKIRTGKSVGRIKTEIERDIARRLKKRGDFDEKNEFNASSQEYNLFRQESESQCWQIPESKLTKLNHLIEN